MMLDLPSMPRWLQWSLPLLRWRANPQGKRLYFTFDDGPTAGVTEPILEILDHYQAKATFFCLGERVTASPELMQRLVAQGHAIGNHGYEHLNGWSTSTASYCQDMQRGQAAIQQTLGRSIRLLRPPYGRLTFRQWLRLRGQYQVVMWEVNSQDYREDLSVTHLFEQITKRARAGSILLFHDSAKSAARTLPLLPLVLDYYAQRGFQFSRLED